MCRVKNNWRMIKQSGKLLLEPRPPYPSDVSDDEWNQVRALIMAQNGRGRTRQVCEREILNAILYVTHCRCPWRMLPHDLPLWPTVYYYYERWQKDGTLHDVRRVLRR
jgi:putative transposase